MTLEAACALYGLAGGTHRAVSDVLATQRLLKALAPTTDEAEHHDDDDARHT